MFERFGGMAILSLALAAGCVTTDAVLLDSARKYPPAQSAEILSVRPSRPFVEVAIIESQGPVNTPVTKLLEEMRKKAQRIGAHAVIPVQGEARVTPTTVMYNPLLGGYQTLGGMSIPIIRGIAIRYTDQ